LKIFRFSRLYAILFGISLFIVLATSAQAQGGSAGGALNQLSMAFSGGKTVQAVQLSGSATWYVGNLEDSGTVSMTASVDGSSTMQLILATTGQRIESQTGSGLDMTYQWAGADGTPHRIASGACWRPALWFLPSLSLQPLLQTGNVAVVDLGLGGVGSSSTIYRHIQSQLRFSGAPSLMTTDATLQSTTDIGLDPSSLLPAVLAYSVRPDDGSPTQIAIEVRYSEYHRVNGVQIPFHIERFVNRALQLDILITAAQIN
jgi:hypothetical protein